MISQCKLSLPPFGILKDIHVWIQPWKFQLYFYSDMFSTIINQLLPTYISTKNCILLLSWAMQSHCLHIIFFKSSTMCIQHYNTIIDIISNIIHLVEDLCHYHPITKIIHTLDLGRDIKGVHLKYSIQNMYQLI